MERDSDYLFPLMQQLQHCDAASARRLLEQAASLHPADPRPLLLLAARHIQDQEPDRAEAAYIAALQAAPDYAIARFQLGLLQFTSSRPSAALATWAPLDKLEEAHPLRLFKMAFESLQNDQFDQACHWLREGIKFNTDNPPLNQDMQLLISRIEGTVAAARDSRAERQSDTTPYAEQAIAATNAESEAHFLLSTYRSVH
ncbi:hypothetical protein [Cupriavidus sp. 8B]